MIVIYSLSGGMYLGIIDNNFIWNILVNKLVLIGWVLFDCVSLFGDCFFVFMGYSFYSNVDLYV